MASKAPETAGAPHDDASERTSRSSSTPGRRHQAPSAASGSGEMVHKETELDTTESENEDGSAPLPRRTTNGKTSSSSFVDPSTSRGSPEDDGGMRTRGVSQNSFRRRHASETAAMTKNRSTNEQLLVTEAGTKQVQLAGGNVYTYSNKEGFLKKKGHVIKTWKSRYFIVDRWRVYYLTEPDGKMQGRFTLGSKSDAWIVNDPKKPCCFAVTSADSDKEFILQASSEHARQQWVAVLKHNIDERIKQLQDPDAKDHEGRRTTGFYPNEESDAFTDALDEELEQKT
eukprot:gb/GECG01010236.1/.p1 GENE.gb/GECG01010236.1/~~gb/GECG01010236.1/.p1  ORF type:complete len:285 (+),score=55.67 gb/GECG01010236.1/:1-855(+)